MPVCPGHFLSHSVWREKGLDTHVLKLAIDLPLHTEAIYPYFYFVLVTAYV